MPKAVAAIVTVCPLLAGCETSPVEPAVPPTEQQMAVPATPKPTSFVIPPNDAKILLEVEPGHE